jgi:glycosyltransferase involved in cell wall biosynthesis
VGDATQPGLDALPVRVIIPAYNRADTVARAVRSAFAQQPRQPAEVVVVDDGSADDTADVAARAGATVVRHPVNRGLGAARNTGLAETTQPWIALLDSDDEWLPHHLASLWPHRAGRVLVAGSALHCAPDGRQRHLGPFEPDGRVLRSPADVATSSIVVASAALIRREEIETVGRFSEFRGALHGVEDVDLWLRLLERGPGFVSGRVSVLYHEHAGQMTGTSNALQTGRRMVLETYADRPWFDARLLDRWDGVMSWDAARLAQWSGDGRLAISHLARVARSPTRLRALLEELRARLRTRRRSSQVTRSGAPTLAVVDPSTVPSQPPAGFEAVVPPGRTRAARYAALARHPTAALLVGGHGDRVLAQMLGMRAIRPRRD